MEEWKSMLTFDNVLILCFASEEDPRTQKSKDCNCQAPKPIKITIAMLQSYFWGDTSRQDQHAKQENPYLQQGTMCNCRHWSWSDALTTMKLENCQHWQPNRLQRGKKKRNIIMKSNSGISTSNQIKECTNLETNLKWYVWTIRSIKSVKISTSVGYFT
jgi:hypothetical protein